LRASGKNRRTKRRARAVSKTPAPAAPCIRIIWLDKPGRFLVIYG